MKILDCTLRDGGYYCNWDFDEATVRKYLAAAVIAKIDIIEIGFRFIPQNRFLGPFAYSSDEYLNTLPLPSNVSIAVMINAKELINQQNAIDEVIKDLFNKAAESRVDIVRIAAHADEIDECEEIAQQLVLLGYRVMLNLMQIDSFDSSEITKLASKISNWNSVDVLYFADSFGAMNPESIDIIVKSITSGWSGGLGIHAHDNKGQALANCMAAIKSGVTYLDGTLLGMGRGAGNVKTENILVELVQHGYGEYFPDALFPLVIQEFQGLQDRYKWGPNIYYFLSAVHGIHPTYIQEMLGDERYETEQILSSINFLKSTRTPFFSFETMLKSISGLVGNEKGSWNSKDWVKGRTVLIVGSGKSTKRYISAISQYIKNTNPIVLCLNINESIPQELVTAYVACHDTRVLIEADFYSRLTKPLILPLSRVPKSISEALNGIEILDYGLRIKDGSFEIYNNGCVLGSSIALMYAISVATMGGAEKIIFAGMDGFENSDPRQKEIVNLLDNYKKLEFSLPITAITPTTYPVEQRSVFEPGL